jgi:hypothetical protein
MIKKRYLKGNNWKKIYEKNIPWKVAQKESLLILGKKIYNLNQSKNWIMLLEIISILMNLFTWLSINISNT